MKDTDTQPEAPYWRCRWGLLAVIAALYGMALPQTVQTLDTGELVGAAWRLTVTHPPGYPLYIWLQHLFMNACPWGSPFHRAALGNALCVLGAMALLLRACRGWHAVALVAAVATTPLVWRFAVLPDVFGLHLLLTVALSSLALAPPSRPRTWGAALVFGLAAANHQSIVFLAPLVLLVALEERSRPIALGAIAAGASLTIVAYLSLLALDTESTSSWGHLTSIRDVLYHFLRNNYGTLRLSGYSEQVDVAAVLRAFASVAGPVGIAAVALIASAGAMSWRQWRARGTRAWWLTLACLVLYIVVFFPRMNLGAHPIHLAVRDRFFLFPIVLLAVLAVRASAPLVRLPRLRPLLTLTLVTVAAIQTATADAYAFPDDTVVEDYARNLLDTARSADEPALVLVDSDTQVFAAQYVQATQPGYEDVVVMSRGNMFFVETLAKIKRRWPAFEYDAEAIFADPNRDIFRLFVMPNVEHFAIFHVLPVTTARGRTTFYPLGRRVEAGSGVFIADTAPPVRAKAPVYEADSRDYVETKELYAEYAVYHLARGKALLESSDRDGARRAFLDGLARVPYCIPCLKNVCVLDDNDPKCLESLKDLEDNEYHYFE